MELRHLRYFVAVAEHLHYGRAAAKLHIAQPALSQQIRKLETELGLELFHRTSRRVELTDHGATLLPTARDVLSQAEQFATLAEALQAGEAGHIRIGFVASVMNWGLSERLRAFRVQYPAAQVSATQMPVADQVSALLDNHIDIGFAMGRLNYDQIATRTFADEPLKLVIPVDHPKAGTGPIPLAEMAEEKILSYSGPFGEHLEDYISRACLDAGFAPRLVLHGAQSHTLVHMVAAGFGIGLLPACDECLAVPGVVFAPIASPVPMIKLSAITHKWHQIPLAARLLTVVTADVPADKMSI
jgi:DNA-binding transcriptional LysR family regulator